MLPKKIESALNRQLAVEADASYFYLSAASWCESNGLHGCAKYLFNQSEEERQHMLKIFNYINETGGHAVTPGIKQPQSSFRDIGELFKAVLAREVSTTESINDLISLAIAEKEHATNTFLQWFASEQHQEENEIRTILDKIKLIGLDGKGVYWIDKEMGAMASGKE